MSDHFIDQFEKPKPPRPEFAASLYERISKPMNTEKNHSPSRTLRLALAGLAILTAIVLVVPSAQTFAGGILKIVGGFAFQQGIASTAGPRAPGQVSVVRDGRTNSLTLSAAPNTPSAVDAAGASELAGFPVVVPSYLPSGYAAIDKWYVEDRQGGKMVTNAYRDGNDHFLMVNQLKSGKGVPPETYTREQIVDVVVRGQTGVWLPSSNVQDGKSVLLWEESGLTYYLITNVLPLDEMTKVANSLGTGG